MDMPLSGKIFFLELFEEISPVSLRTVYASS
jgi:hypothetical protein